MIWETNPCYCGTEPFSACDAFYVRPGGTVTEFRSSSPLSCLACLARDAEVPLAHEVGSFVWSGPSCSGRHCATLQSSSMSVVACYSQYRSGRQSGCRHFTRIRLEHNLDGHECLHAGPLLQETYGHSCSFLGRRRSGGLAYLSRRRTCSGRTQGVSFVVCSAEY